MSESFFLLPFLIGIVAGFVLLYIYKQPKIVIMDFPKPFDKTIYTDKNNVKYQYVTKEVDCDKNEKNLKPYPIQ